MERRAALLVAAATTIVGTGSTIALAAFGGAGLLGFGSAFGSPDVAEPASPSASDDATAPSPHLSRRRHGAT